MNLLYTKKEVKKVIFKTSKKLVDNHTFYLENLKKAIFRVLNSYSKGLKDVLKHLFKTIQSILKQIILTYLKNPN
jgi:hypothetical protein